MSTPKKRLRPEVYRFAWGIEKSLQKLEAEKLVETPRRLRDITMLEIEALRSVRTAAAVARNGNAERAGWFAAEAAAYVLELARAGGAFECLESAESREGE